MRHLHGHTAVLVLSLYFVIHPKLHLRGGHKFANTAVTWRHGSPARTSAVLANCTQQHAALLWKVPHTGFELILKPEAVPPVTHPCMFT